MRSWSVTWRLSIIFWGSMVPTLAAQPAGTEFRIWALADPHVHSDLYRRAKELRREHPERPESEIREGTERREDARESLASAIRQSESADGFQWDIALLAGDFSGSHGIPDDREGLEIVRQFGALQKHRREDVYSVCGNHDASPGQRWFQKWIDPLGLNAKYSGVDSRLRKYPPAGTWERYSFRVGNMLFLMLSDRNDYAPPVGCIVDGKGYGGRPAGAVTLDTFRWWQKQVESAGDLLVVTVSHHMLKETTIGSGEWEGYPNRPPFPRGVGDRRYHGYFAEDGEHNKGAGYVYWLVDESQQPADVRPDAQVFESYLRDHPGAVDLWIGGHTHSDPDDSKNGRRHIMKKWGTWFVNCAALCKHHGGDHSTPLSRLITLRHGQREVRVQCYLHSNDFAAQGWYPTAEQKIVLDTSFVRPLDSPLDLKP